VAGDYLRAREQRDFARAPGDIYLGDRLMEALALELEDRVVLTVSPRGSAQPASAAFVVRGVFHSGMDELDGFYVEIPLGDAQELLGLGDRVTQVALLVDQLADAGPVAAALERALADPSLEVLPWQRALVELHEAIVLDDVSMYLLMAIVFLIVAIGIFNTVLMSVVERTREFGVMLAVGTTPGRLFRFVMAEAALLAAVASAAGLALGLALHGWLASTGIDVAALYGEEFEFAGIVLEGRIYSRLSPAVVAGWTAVVIGVVLASALYPALRATRLAPVEAMRHA
jgi:ABC-type lipoprotein release transport system permease subunit